MADFESYCRRHLSFQWGMHEVLKNVLAAAGLEMRGGQYPSCFYCNFEFKLDSHDPMRAHYR